MNYYIDTEFLNGEQDKKFLGYVYGKTKPTISMSEVSELTA
jgi:hypothetical protein